MKPTLTLTSDNEDAPQPTTQEMYSPTDVSCHVSDPFDFADMIGACARSPIDANYYLTEPHDDTVVLIWAEVLNGFVYYTLAGSRVRLRRAIRRVTKRSVLRLLRRNGIISPSVFSQCKSLLKRIYGAHAK